MNRWRIVSQKGFTIIELIIVIAIIGILAAIVIVGYSAVQNNAQDGGLRADLGKIGDSIKLTVADNKGAITGGATSSGTGDATTLTGVSVSPNKASYDTTVNNLFFCTGSVNSVVEFAVVAKATSGKIFAYKSNGGIKELSSSTAMTYDALCPAAGFSAPYTWSYGYDINPYVGWLSWANN